MKNPNIYKPYLMRIQKITDEAPGVKTFRLVFENEEEGNRFDFKAGQFGAYSVFNEGECTFREAGRVTGALANLEEGQTIGFRGPYGNIFPIEEWKGKSLLFIAGGIALPPMRCVIWNCLDLRDWFKDVTILYGARTVADLVYKQELDEWAKRPDVKLVTTVDPGGETPDWKGEIGFVPTVLERMAPKSENTVAIVCGPPIMIKFTFPVLTKLGFPPGDVFTTLENRMKCGIGKCGRCNVGKYFVCKDGPVFTFTQLKDLPPEY